MATQVLFAPWVCTAACTPSSRLLTKIYSVAHPTKLDGRIASDSSKGTARAHSPIFNVRDTKLVRLRRDISCERISSGRTIQVVLYLQSFSQIPLFSCAEISSHLYYCRIYYSKILDYRLMTNHLYSFEHLLYLGSSSMYLHERCAVDDRYYSRVDQFACYGWL